MRLTIGFLLSLAFSMAAHGQQRPAVIEVGGAKFEHWSGLGTSGPGGATTLPASGEAVFHYPKGPLGFHKHGYRLENDSSADWQPYYGIRFDVNLETSEEVEIVVRIIPALRAGPQGEGVQSRVRVTGPGWHTVALPWSAFAFDQIRTSFLRFVSGLSISAASSAGAAVEPVGLRNVEVVEAPVLALECPVRGKPVQKGSVAEYPVSVSNCTRRPLAVVLSLVKYGWEVMEAAPSPANLQLGPGETREIVLRVTVPDRVPLGGHEDQVLQAIANGDASTAARLTFTTVSELPHPYILHTPAGWQEVRDKVKKYPWAKDLLSDYVSKADAWNVPEVTKPPENDPHDNSGPYVFPTQNENGLMACAVAWQVTRDIRYAQKAAEFLRRLSNPIDGYPATLRGSNQSEVQEGHFFQHIAMSYDMILDSGVLSAADCRQIEATFRLLIDVIDRIAEGGSINNWNLSEVTGAFYCSLAMHDLVAARRFFSGPGGIEDQLSKGTMDDGWWYECSISYNLWCASEFTQAALAYQAFGVNFKDAWVPASYSPHVLLVSELNGGNRTSATDPEQRRKPFGMDPDVVGPVRRPYRAIRDLWNSLIPFLDYRGVMFGVNDSTENSVAGNRTEVGGAPFELAYYAYRDPAYASIIKLGGGKRDLLYGVPELPANTPENYRASAYADNVGLAMLRSQKENRPIRDQIEAALHYGTHGWAHGHYDRTDLLCLMRYGRNFWNPESVFYVYEPFMYKFYTQTSLNHNMVVVDEKMQEATPGKRLLFQTGKMMQAAAVQTTARWSYPPYGGMVYDYVPVKTFAEKTWREGRYVPIPENPPAYGTLTGFTEPILQRRLMLVTDDYVVLADYLKASGQHTFESLLQLKGFEDLSPAKLIRHDAQWNPDPLAGAQFVTDCNWYSAQAPTLARFQEKWGPGADEEGSRSTGNEPGVLNLDVHTLWPQAQQIMAGTAPEQHDVEKRLYYSVRTDGKTVAEGKFGAWILGQGNIDVPLDGVKQLELETKAEIAKRPTLFWAGARIVTRAGKEISISELHPRLDNIVESRGPGLDYFGGPIKICGNLYKDATPAEPKDEAKPGIVRVDFAGLDAVRFKAVIGSDYPPGPEAQRRKVFAVRSEGDRARFLTVIEPYEKEAVIKSAAATSADQLRVELADGRVQEIAIHNMEGSGKDLSATITESREGSVLRNETVTAESNP